jgi:hypothetical protein
MKTVFGCSMAAVAAFAFMGLQTGLFGPRASKSSDEPAEVKVVKKSAVVRAQFPEDLAPAARAKPVAAAAEFKVGDRPHKMVFLKVNGAPHEWQKDAGDYNEEWIATNVEETELVIVVSRQTRSVVDTKSFSNGPPIERERWELEASVIEAKTGKALANRRFINLPREIRNLEAYETTSLGAPVKYLTVFNWAMNQSKFGFNSASNLAPITTVEKRQ